MSENNQLMSLSAPNNQVAQVVSDLFRDIDFKGISKAIEKIANSNAALSIEEKEMASGLVDQWERDVMARLREKGQEMMYFINFFDNGQLQSNSGREKFKEIAYQLADRTNTLNEYNKVQDIIDELEELYDSRPIKPIEEEDKTKGEMLEAYSKYDLESARYELAVKKKVRELYLAEADWKKLLKQNKEVRELLAKARSYNKNLHKFQNVCHDKSQLAKLNIAISNDDVRDALRELLNFSAEI